MQKKITGSEADFCPDKLFQQLRKEKFSKLSSQQGNDLLRILRNKYREDRGFYGH